MGDPTTSTSQSNFYGGSFYFEMVTDLQQILGVEGYQTILVENIGWKISSDKGHFQML